MTPKCKAFHTANPIAKKWVYLAYTNHQIDLVHFIIFCLLIKNPWRGFLLQNRTDGPRLHVLRQQIFPRCLLFSWELVNSVIKRMGPEGNSIRMAAPKLARREFVGVPKLLPNCEWSCTLWDGNTVHSPCSHLDVGIDLVWRWLWWCLVLSPHG